MRSIEKNQTLPTPLFFLKTSKKFQGINHQNRKKIKKTLVSKKNYCTIYSKANIHINLSEPAL